MSTKKIQKVKHVKSQNLQLLTGSSRSALTPLSLSCLPILAPSRHVVYPSRDLLVTGRADGSLHCVRISDAGDGQVRVASSLLVHRLQNLDEENPQVYGFPVLSRAAFLEGERGWVA